MLHLSQGAIVQPARLCTRRCAPHSQLRRRTPNHSDCSWLPEIHTPQVRRTERAMAQATAKSELEPLAAGGSVVVAAGVAYSLLLPSGRLPGGWGVINDVLGITYMCAWSYSFYPQFLLNWQRKCDPRPPGSACAAPCATQSACSEGYSSLAQTL